MRNLIITSNGEPRYNSILTKHYKTDSITQTAISITTDERSTTSSTTVTQSLTRPSNFLAQLKTNGATQSKWATIATQVGQSAVNDTVYRLQVGLLSTSAGQTAYMLLSYIAACPPYDMGDGEVPLFVYAIIDNASGKVETVASCIDPPWAGNDIVPHYYRNGKSYRKVKIKTGDIEKDILFPQYEEIEISKEYKNKDMELSPHPFMGEKFVGKTLVLLDPVCDLMHKLCDHHKFRSDDEKSVNQLFHEGYLKIDNTPLNRKVPNGVMPVSAKWKLTK